MFMAAAGGEQDHEQPPHEAAEPGSLPPSLQAKESYIIFDWDDTILPTSWLERIHALTGGGPLRPEVQRQLSTLCQVVVQTLNLAMTLGTVVIITNSAPGWVDQSCQLFMPQILNQIRQYPIFPKPMHAPLTFKITCFKRECRGYKNVVSVGDGDAERVASLRLQVPTERKGDGMPQRVKSVKLVELPTCHQLVCQHEMLQVRLPDVAAFQGCLDLKARFPPSGGFASPNSGPGKAGGCTLVHFTRPQLMGGQAPIRPFRESASPPPAPVHEDAATAAGGRLVQAGLVGNRNKLGGMPAGQASLPPLGPGGRQLTHSNADLDLAGNRPANGLSLSSPPAESSTSAGDVSGPMSGGPILEVNLAHFKEGPMAEDVAGEPHHELVSSQAATGPLWKVQNAGGAVARPLYGRGTSLAGQKKRPVLVSGMPAARGAAAWREHSAPAAARGGRTDQA
eukprot:TRINITY_DN113005_c0_g1_i1.p1 TRINITY_DN113005_c0_g1~~TRINITY_DN113005_c0_g1_i1.p1  ORF type:complete len:452 (-),score=53.07 TRINITY_DN113005_c0_g1_i1:134-1489(-)